MRVKSVTTAQQVLELHLVNAIARAILSDAHAEYLQPPGSNNRSPMRGLSSTRKLHLPPAEDAMTLALAVAEEQGQVDPARLAPEVHRVLPYLVTVNPLTVCAGNRCLSLPGAQVALEPALEREAWETIKESRIPVELREGRWRWRPWVRPEEREAWTKLARLLLVQLPAAQPVAS